MKYFKLPVAFSINGCVSLTISNRTHYLNGRQSSEHDDSQIPHRSQPSELFPISWSHGTFKTLTEF